MAKFERCLEALENRGDLQEAGRDRPYPLDWVTIEYPASSRSLRCFTLTAMAPRVSTYATLDLRQGTLPRTMQS